MKKPVTVKAFAIASLRRASYRWSPREAARRKSKIARNQYVCAICKNIFTRKETKLDHITPVVPLTGWINFDSFIERLYCTEDEFQVLCHSCHNIKTQKENLIRKSYRIKK